jgi:hypothetical protein
MPPPPDLEALITELRRVVLDAYNSGIADGRDMMLQSIMHVANNPPAAPISATPTPAAPTAAAESAPAAPNPAPEPPATEPAPAPPKAEAPSVPKRRARPVPIPVRGPEPRGRAPKGLLDDVLDDVLAERPGMVIKDLKKTVLDRDPRIAVRSVYNRLRLLERETGRFRRVDMRWYRAGDVPKTGR